MGWQLLPLLGEAVEIAFYVLALALRAQLVGLGEDDGEGHSILAQPFDELEVYGQWLVAYVDEQEEVGHLFASEDVVLDDLRELVLGLLAALRVAIAGKVDEIPGLIDEEMVDEHCLARCGRGHGQLGLAGEHVDEARLAHVGAAYEGIFGQSVLRTAVDAGVAYNKFCTFDFHVF